jgi:hypothetical protein
MIISLNIRKGNRRMLAYENVIWKTYIKRHDTLQIMYLVVGEGDLQCFNVVEEMLHFAPAYKRKYIGSLVHHVGDRD